MKNLFIEDFNIYNSGNVVAYLKDTDFLQKLNEKSKILNWGRGYVLDVDGYIIRFYFHGGIFRFLLSDYFFSEKRFLNELSIHNYLYKNNFNVPKPIGVIYFKKFIWYHGVFITKKIEGAIDLIDALREGKYIDFYQIGKFVRRLHDFHVIHGDLHLKNFLIDKNLNFYLIDFDKSFFSENEKDKLNNIFRFFRSIYKFQYYNFKIDIEKTIEQFLKGYGLDNNLKNKIKLSFFNKISWKLNKPLYKRRNWI